MDPTLARQTRCYYHRGQDNCSQICANKSQISCPLVFDHSVQFGKKLYLQLKSGDSYLRTRKRDGAEIFDIKKARHAKYWMDQAFPVMLVIRNSKGEIRWMEVRDWLKCASDNDKKTVKQIVFEGERFDVMSVRRWRDKALGRGLPGTQRCTRGTLHFPIQIFCLEIVSAIERLRERKCPWC